MKTNTLAMPVGVFLSILACVVLFFSARTASATDAANSGAVPDIQGTCEGTLEQPGSGVNLGESPKSLIVLRITRVNGAYQARLENLDWGTQEQFDTITYTYPSVHGGTKSNESCDGTVDPSGEKISGTVRQNNKTYTMVVRRTTHPLPFPEALADTEFAPRAGSDLQGFWVGQIGRGAGTVHFKIKIAEASDGTFRSDFYVPDQGGGRQPTTVSYDGTTVKLMPMDGYGMFEGQ